MQVAEELIEGIFLRESKNRFICLVQVDQALVECYVPNSSKMEKYLKLKGKRVLLTVNKQGNGRTKYSLFAVKHYSSYILLNLNLVNSLLETAILEKRLFPNQAYEIYKERTVEGYRADLLLENSEEKLIVEAKGIISTSRAVLFPTVYSARVTKQLLKLKKLLSEGWKVHYIFSSLKSFC